MARSFTDRFLGGVCGGLGSATPLSATLWRILFILATLLTVGAAALVYLFFWWIIPQELPVSDKPSGIFTWLMLIVSVVVVIGGWFMRDSIVGTNGESLYVPILLLFGGILLLTRQFGKGRNNLLWSLILIAVAVILILNAMGSIPEGVFDLIQRSWPVLLIFGGLSLLLRDRIQLGSWIALILVIALVGGIANFAYTTRSDEEREDNVVEVQQEIEDDVQLLQINIETLATEVEFLPRTDNERMIDVRFVGSMASNITNDYELDESGLATFTLREQQTDGFPLLESVGRGSIRVELPADLAMAISFKGTNGNATFSMSDLDLERLNVELDHGDALVTLPDYQPRSPSVQLDPGDIIIYNGNLTLSIPEDIGAHLSMDYNFDIQPEFDERFYSLLIEGTGRALETRLYETFDKKITYNITVPRGLISLEIE